MLQFTTAQSSSLEVHLGGKTRSEGELPNSSYISLFSAYAIMTKYNFHVYLKTLPGELGYFLHQYPRSLFHSGIFTWGTTSASVFAGVQVWNLSPSITTEKFPSDFDKVNFILITMSFFQKSKTYFSPGNVALNVLTEMSRRFNFTIWQLVLSAISIYSPSGAVKIVFPNLYLHGKLQHKWEEHLQIPVN